MTTVYLVCTALFFVLYAVRISRLRSGEVRAPLTLEQRLRRTLAATVMAAWALSMLLYTLRPHA